MPLPLLGPALLGTGAYLLARKARQNQLAKDVAAQSRAIAQGTAASAGKPADVHGDGHRHHRHGAAGCFACDLAGFGAAPGGHGGGGGAKSSSPPAQRSTVVASSRPAAPVTVPSPAQPSVATSPLGSYGYGGGGYGGGYTAITAREAGERMAYQEGGGYFAERQALYDTGDPDAFVDDGSVYEVIDTGPSGDWGHRHHHWY